MITGNLSEIPCGKSHAWHVENGYKDKVCPPKYMNFKTTRNKQYSQATWYAMMEKILENTTNLVIKIYENGRHANTYEGCAETIRAKAYKLAIKKGACQNTRKSAKPATGYTFTVEAA